MKTKITIALFIAVFTGFLNPANAQIIKKERTQHQRIRQGVKSGELTPAEAANLRQGQKEIRQEVKTAKADGVITPGERKEIKKDQRKESRKIYRKKHNVRVR